MIDLEIAPPSKKKAQKDDSKLVPSDEKSTISFDLGTPSKSGKKKAAPAQEQPTAHKAVVDDDPIDDAPQPKAAARPKIKGVFSHMSTIKVGTGTTQRKSITKSYFFCEEMEGEGEPVVMVQPLNKNNIPAGPKESVVLGEFLAQYEPEVEFYQTDVFPKMRDLDKTLKRAENKRDLGAYYSAEMEFGAALQVDEENVRANFGLGLTYMERGEPAKAKDLFKRLVDMDAAFAPEHKHLFNEFGINLRKSKLLDQAVDYYARALEMTEEDEHLHYNIARAYFERGESKEALEHLEKALELKPNFEEAKSFLAYLEKNNPPEKAKEEPAE